MNLTCHYTFNLPEGAELLVRRRHGEAPEELHFDIEPGIAVIVEVPARGAGDGPPMIVSSNLAEGWEIWALSRIAVEVLTGHELEKPDPGPLKDIESVVREQSDPRAIDAASRFLRITRWRTEQFWLPEILGAHNAVFTVGFYLDRARIPYSSSQISVTLPADETALSESSTNSIRADLANNAKPALRETLLLDAMLYRSQGDNRIALVLAAISLEIALSNLIESLLTKRKVATPSQIRKFVEETSKRLLCTVVLSQLNIDGPEFRDLCRCVFETRNGVVHGKKKNVSKQEATDAIDAARQMARLLQ